MSEPTVVDCTPELARRMASQEPVGRDYAKCAFENQQAGRVRFLVAMVDDEPVGSCEVTTERRPKIFNLNVRAPFRGRGLGTLLIEHAERAAADRGELAIWVDQDNPRARRLYLRLGFEPTGVNQTATYVYVDDDGERRQATETDVELVKRLPQPD